MVPEGRTLRPMAYSGSVDERGVVHVQVLVHPDEEHGFAQRMPRGLVLLGSFATHWAASDPDTSTAPVTLPTSATCPQ